MMHDGDPQKARLLARFKPMATLTMKNGVPPEKVDVVSGNAQGTGPVGFSAALLPFLQNRDACAVQRQRVADHFPGQRCLLQLCADSLWTRLISTVFASPSKVNYYLTGAGMRKFTLSLMHAFCRLAVETPYPQRAFRHCWGYRLVWR